MKLVPRRLGPKLNLFLLVLLLLLGTATAAVMFLGFCRTQDDATEESRKGLENQGRVRLEEMAGQTASIGGLILAQATDAGANASDLYVDFPSTGATSSWTSARMTPDGFGGYVDFTPQRTTDAWIDADAQGNLAAWRDLQESAALDTLLPTLLERSIDAVAVYYLGESGATRYFPQREYAARNALELTTPQQRTIAAAGPEQNPSRAPVWTEPYPDPSGDALLLTAYTPVYVGDAYRGVIGVDLSIDRLVAQADAIDVSPTGFAFLMDRNGEILEGEAYDVVVAAQADESNVTFESILRDMQAGGRNNERATLGGREVLIGYAPLSVGGSLAVVAPVDEVTAESEAVASEIRSEGNRTIAIAMGTMAALFAMALVAFAWMNRRMLLRPIEALVAGTRTVAEGDLSKRIPVVSNDELGSLADSFNSMTLELEMSRSRLETQREQIHRSEAELRALFNAMNDAVFVLDRNGRYLRAAPTRYTDALGPLTSAIGRTMHDVMPASQAEALMAPLRNAIDTGDVQEVEHRVEMPEGGERWVLATVSKLTDDTALVVARDITSRKEAEQALAEREEQYRGIFEEAKDALFITTLEGELVDVNPAAWQMHGYEREEFLKLSPPDFIHQDDHHIFVEYLASVAAGRRYVARARDIRKDGSLFYVEVIGTPISYGGKPHVLGVVRDVTERVQQEQLLEQRVEDRTRELASLLEVSRAVSSTLEVRRLAQSILDELVKVVDYTGATLAAVMDDNMVILDSYGPFAEEVVSGPTASVPMRLMDTPFWSGVRRGEPIVIDDIEADTALAREYRRTFEPFLEMPSFKVIRSWLAVPLMHQDRFVGVFTASHVEPFHFTPETGNLVMAAASQAAVAIENARLFEQTRERTRELTSLLEVSRTVAAELEVQPLLELMLDEVHAVAPFDRAAFLQIDGDSVVVVASRDIRPERAARELGSRFPLDPGTRGWLSSDEAQPVIVGDITGDSREARAYRRAISEETVSERFADIRSWMAVPLRLKDRPIGMLTIARQRPGFYDQRHGQLATAIASQAAVALENARLFQQTEERTRELTSLLEVTRTVVSTLDVDRLLDGILTELESMAPYHRAAFMVLEDEMLTVVASRDERSSVAAREKGDQFRLGPTSALWNRIRDRGYMIIDDVEADDENAADYRGALGPRYDPANPPVGSWMAVPLFLKEGAIGMLAVGNHRRGFYTHRHAELTAALASQAAVSLENARLFEQAERHTRELASLLDVSRNVASTLATEPLLETILDALDAVAPYERAAFLLLDNDDLVNVAPRDERPGVAESQKGDRYSVRGRAVIWDAVRHGKNVIIDDITRDDDETAVHYRKGLGERIAITSDTVRSWMAVPIFLRDQAVGMLAVANRGIGFYTARHAELAASLASQAAVALENARLFEQTEERTHELETILRLTGNVGSTLDLDRLLTAILDQTREVAEYRRALIIIREGDEFQILQTRMFPEQEDKAVGTRVPVDVMPFWAQIERGQPVRIPDVTADTLMAQAFRISQKPVLDRLGEHELAGVMKDMRSWLAVPLTSKNGVIGAVTLATDQADYYSERHTRIVTAIAAQAAVAIENARLFTETQQRTRELSALLRVSNSIASTLKQGPLVANILEQLRTVIDNNGTSILELYGQDLVVMDYDESTAVSDAASIVGGGVGRPRLRFRISEAPEIWERMLAHEVLIIPDVLADDVYAAGFRRAAADRLSTSFSHVRAWMAVPMILRDRVIGILALSHGREGFFGPQHAGLARAIADQAAVAIDNARLFSETERRASEMTALLGLSHTIGSTLELRPLIAVILEQLRTIVPYAGASIIELHGDRMSIVDWQAPGIVTTAPPQQPLEFSLRHAPNLMANIERREPMVIRDVHDPRDEQATQFRATVGEALMGTLFKQVTSWIGVPLVAQDRALGLLTMTAVEADFFTPDRVRATTLVANQAAVALENAHLYEEADARTRELSALLEVSGAVASTLELRPLASVVLDQLRNVIEYDGASLLLAEDQALTIIDDRAVVGANEVIGFSIPLNRASELWDRLHAQRPILINDVRSDEPMARAYRQVLGDWFDLPAFEHVTSWMAVPLSVQDRVIGMMSMSRREAGYFTERHVRLARAIADQAAVAIENARLYEQAQQLAAVEERQRLARELHDSVSQALYGVALGARTARTLLDRDPAKATEPVEYVMSLAEAGLAEMRALIFELRPESLELEGLVAGLEKQSAALRARHNIEVNADLGSEPDAPLAVKEAIARIAQEAMHNTVKHARASHVTLRLRQNNGSLELDVEDDGRGFDPTQPYAGHLGLRSMRERASKLGGEISMESAPGDGARIHVSIPVNGSGR